MYPTRRFLWLLVALTPLALVPAMVAAALWPVWALPTTGLVAAWILDALFCLRPRRVSVRVEVPADAMVGDPFKANLIVESKRAIRVRAVLDLDDNLQPAGNAEAEHRVLPTIEVLAKAGQPAIASWTLRAARRGTASLPMAWLRWTGPLGLVERVASRPETAHVRIAPDLRPVRRAALRLANSSELSSGLKTERFVGDGTEFDALQRYVPGLDPRSIDWKASARHRRLLSRRFRAERNHQLVLAIDCGRLMAERLGTLSRLDHAIHRALMLGYVGLATGDRVGLAHFGGEPKGYLEPAPGLRRFEALRRVSSEIEYGVGETNFTLAMLDLTSRLRRRSLVVVFTEFVDSVTAQLMVDRLATLARRHVVLFVALRDVDLDAHGRDPLRETTDLHRAVVRAQLRNERELVLAKLRAIGVHVVDATPEAIDGDLINRYLDIKRRELVG